MTLLISLINDTKFPSISEGAVRAIAEPLMREHKLEGEWLLDLSFVETAAMRQLNLDAQGHDEPTDVLSFPVQFATDKADPSQEWPTDGPKLLGSLVIAPEVAAKQAPDHHRTTEEEIAWLIDHGLHHLLGYDHDDAANWLPRTH